MPCSKCKMAFAEFWCVGLVFLVTYSLKPVNLFLKNSVIVQKWDSEFSYKHLQCDCVTWYIYYLARNINLFYRNLFISLSCQTGIYLVFFVILGRFSVSEYDVISHFQKWRHIKTVFTQHYSINNCFIMIIL